MIVLHGYLFYTHAVTLNARPHKLVFEYVVVEIRARRKSNVSNNLFVARIPLSHPRSRSVRGQCCCFTFPGGYSALHWAAERGHEEILEVLLDAGSEVDSRAGLGGHSNMTPLHVSCHNGHTPLAKRLLDAGADFNATRQYLDRLGITCLHLATENGHLETVRLLLATSIDKDAQDSKGFTPLHLAVQYGFTQIAEALVAANASLKRMTIAGWTPIKLASKYDNKPMLDMLNEERLRRKGQPIPEGDTPRSKKKRGSGIWGLLCGSRKSMPKD